MLQDTKGVCVLAADIMRLTYKRGDSVKFVSHLDFVKVFERAIRRARIEVAFSCGFNPRMQLVFGNPLPVGLTSDCELLDITFARPYEPSEIIDLLNSTLPGEITVLSAKPLIKPYDSILCSVSFAEYTARIGSISPEDEDSLNSAFYSCKELMTMKRSKSGEKLVDIKPMIKSFLVKDGALYITVATGMGGNLRPELAFSAVCEKAGVSADLISIHKNNMY